MSSWEDAQNVHSSLIIEYAKLRVQPNATRYQRGQCVEYHEIEVRIVYRAFPAWLAASVSGQISISSDGLHGRNPSEQLEEGIGKHVV